MSNLDDLEAAGSGWTLSYVHSITLEIGKCLLVGSGGNCNIKELPGSQYLIDVDLGPSVCFLRAFAQYFITEYTVKNTLTWIKKNCLLKKFKLPMSIHKIAAFEKKHNHLNVGINVF